MSKRQFIIFSGNENWGIEESLLLLSPITNADQKILCSATQVPQLFAKNIKQVSINSKAVDIEQQLGTEYAGLVVNAYQGFNPNLFCALAATVRTPGLIILITPKLNLWPKYDDKDYRRFISYPYTNKFVKGRYISYLINALLAGQGDKHINLLNQCDPNTVAQLQVLKQDTVNSFLKHKSQEVMQTLDKGIVTSKIIQLMDHNKKQLLLICAPRGRGKSASIGIALQDILKRANPSVPLSIVVVSQSRRNINTLIKFLNSSLQVKKITQNHFTLEKHSLRYMPPDVCIQQSPKPDIMIIDEAASIPIDQLRQLIKLSNKNVLSTTTQGYEGTGQGFRHKFLKQLDKVKIDYEEISLTKSLRWPEQDSTERWIQNNLLLIPAQQPSFKHTFESIDKKQLIFEKLDRDLLIHKQDILKQVYGLLANAHYRTTPDDLRLFLDAPTASIWTIQFKNTIIAAAVCLDEGELPAELAQQIWLGKRRVQGHLVPQSLISHLGLIHAAPLVYRRISRIAVTPSLQLKGLGKQLVQFICQQSSQTHQQIDCITVSYSANKEMLKFWLGCDFQTIKLGTHKNARSGDVSMIMIKPLSKPAESLSYLADRLLQNSLRLKARFNPDDSTSLVSINSDTSIAVDFLPQYKSDIYCFAFGFRQFDTCHPALYYYALSWLNNPELKALFKSKEIDLIDQKVLKNLDWKNIEHLTGIKGKKPNLIKLRHVYAQLYTAVWGNKS